jgi:hypothetical protein
VISGEAIKAPTVDERKVDAPGRIEVTPMPRVVNPPPPAPAPPVPVKTALPAAPQRRTGVWLLVLVYMISGAALAYAVWERFLR